MISLNNVFTLLLNAWIFTFSVGIVRVGFVPVKLLFMIGILIFMVIYSKKLIISYFRQLVLLGLSVLIWFFWGIYNGYVVTALNEMLSIVAGFGMLAIMFILYENNLLDVVKIRKTILVTGCIGVLMKYIMAFCILFLGIDYMLIINVMRDFFGSVSFDIGTMENGFLGRLPRFGGAFDIMFVIIYAYYIKNKTIENSLATWMTMFGFCILVYSRYVMLTFGLVTMIMIFEYLKNKNNRYRFIKLTTVVVSLVLLLINFIDINLLIEGFIDRFTGEQQTISDGIRTIQYEYMLEDIKENYLFGIGLGGYSLDYIHYRFWTITKGTQWRTELEYMLLFLQFGIFGFVTIVLNYIYYSIRYLKKNITFDIYSLVIVSLLFVTPLQSMMITSNILSFLLFTVLIMSDTKSNEI